MKGFLVGVLSAILICSTAAFVQSVPPTLPPKLVELNNRISWHDIDDGTGNLVRTLRFNGINIQITNGLGTTASFNSAGNLIVGYNEIGNPTGDIRTGSHSIIIGQHQSLFDCYGNITSGIDNTINAHYSVAIAGEKNVINNQYATVIAGVNNSVDAIHGFCVGGNANFVSFLASRGGIIGGATNIQDGEDSTIIAGYSNYNYVNNQYVAICGGFNRVAIDSYDFIGGSIREDQ